MVVSQPEANLDRYITFLFHRETMVNCCRVGAHMLFLDHLKVKETRHAAAVIP